MKILFTGDVCFKYQTELDFAGSEKILARVKPTFDSADYRVMNLETPLAEEGVGAPIPKSGPNIIGRPCNIGFLEAAGCDLVTLANNHTGDYGDEALFATLELLDERKIARVGAGHDIAEAYKAHRAEICGVKVSFIGVCENEFGIADFKKAGSAGFDIERLGDAIELERSLGNKVIVIFHGGNEHNPLPSPLCRERYRTIIRLGADALVAHHTHCIQGFEYYRGKPIVYSLGNFLFKYVGMKSDYWFRGYMAMLSLEGDGFKVEPIPYRFERDGSDIIPYKGEDKAAMLDYIAKLSSYIGDTEELTRLYKGWCTSSGVNYLKAMKSPSELLASTEPSSEHAPLKNLLSCEAHNELCRTTLNLAFFGELEAAREWYEELTELQKAPR